MHSKLGLSLYLLWIYLTCGTICRITESSNDLSKLLLKQEPPNLEEPLDSPCLIEPSPITQFCSQISEIDVTDTPHRFKLLTAEAKISSWRLSNKYRKYHRREYHEDFSRYCQIVNLLEEQSERRSAITQLRQLIDESTLKGINHDFLGSGISFQLQLQRLEEIVNQAMKMLNTFELRKKERCWLLGLVACAQRQFPGHVSIATYRDRDYLYQGELELSLIGGMILSIFHPYSGILKN